MTLQGFNVDIDMDNVISHVVSDGEELNTSAFVGKFLTEGCRSAVLLQPSVLYWEKGSPHTFLGHHCQESCICAKSAFVFGGHANARQFPEDSE